MFNLKVASYALPLLLSQVLPSLAGVPRLAQPLIERAEGEGVIEALLRTPNSSSRSASGLVSRQGGTCDPGYLPCSDGNGCCPVGKYCGTWGGKLGCCTIGKTCVANNNPCDYEGYVPCAGEDFCCPSGDTCSRDSTGARQCLRNSPTFTNLPLTSSTRAFTNTLASTVPAAGPDGTTDLFPTTTQRTVTAQPTTTSGGGLLPNPFSSNSGNGAPASAGGASALLIVAGLAINALV
ncbi:hypothetical protein LshimejAT787_1201310 [Lyophyllum shimeji]|uniref:GPI anchored protein n=1 Tax=Lyophyllum shimeji TaxID=47721 RepID=A0A9P3PTQ0_LYOSH|nr:hypothetical protein LshimejAT787_1201310 [Lyophyllum shimeji]